MTIATRFWRRRGQRRLCAIAALFAGPGVVELPRALVGLSVPCSALCSPRLAQAPWPRGRDLCDRCRRYEVLSPLRFASNDYWSLESRPCAELRSLKLGVEVAQPRLGRPRERCVKGPPYHSNRCTELASCKDTRNSSPGPRRHFVPLQPARHRTTRSGLPFVLETARCKFPAAASRRTEATSSASHLAPRAQLAAQPTRRRRERHQTPAAAAPPARAPPVRHYVRLRGVRLRVGRRAVQL